MKRVLLDTCMGRCWKAQHIKCKSSLGCSIFTGVWMQQLLNTCGHSAGKHSFGGTGSFLGSSPSRSDSPSTVNTTVLAVGWTGQCTHPKFQASSVWELCVCASVPGCPNEVSHCKTEHCNISVAVWLLEPRQRGWGLSEPWRCNQGGICLAPAQVWSFFQESELKQSCPWLSATYLSFSSKWPQAAGCRWVKSWAAHRSALHLSLGKSMGILASKVQKPSTWTGTASLTLPAQAIQKLQTGSHTHELVFS